VRLRDNEVIGLMGMKRRRREKKGNQKKVLKSQSKDMIVLGGCNIEEREGWSRSTAGGVGVVGGQIMEGGEILG